MKDSGERRNMLAKNEHYESDIKYTVELNRLLLSLLGIWPSTQAKSSYYESFRRISLILICYILLCSELIPTILYALIIEKQTRIKLKLISSVMFTILAVLKYSSLVWQTSEMRNCLMRMEEDWRNVVSPSAREIMIDKARAARRLFVLCGIFMYSSGLYFRTIVPLTKGKFVNDRNLTLRHLPCPSYFVFFDGRISPSYEIVFFIQFFSGMIKYTITVATCSTAALFVTHTCAQLQILMTLMKDLVVANHRSVNDKLAITVKHQMKMRNFLQSIQHILEYISLMEVAGCTMIICLLGHDVVTEWEDQNVVSMTSYMILLTSIGFNVFILCFIGEQLSTEGEKLASTACTLAWYRLPDAKARSLILIMVMSNVPIKLKAGKFIDLSVRTFGDIVKTAVTYFNLIRKATN